MRQGGLVTGCGSVGVGNGRGLQHKQAGSSSGPFLVVGHQTISDQPVLADILVHGRQDDPVP